MSPQLWPGRAQGSWQTLLELFTAPSCCLLLVHPQLQTSLRCSFHLSLPPFLTSDSEVDLHRCAGGVHLLLRVPHCLEQPGLTKLPLSPACPLPVPCSAPACVQLPGAAGVPWYRWQVLAHRSKCSRAHHSPSPLLCWHLAATLHLSGCHCSASLSTWGVPLPSVTSTSMKHWCLSKGKILGSHFLSKHSC